MTYLDNFTQILNKTNNKYKLLDENTIYFYSNKSLIYKYLLSDLELKNIPHQVIPKYNKNPNNKNYTQNYIIKIFVN